MKTTGLAALPLLLLAGACGHKAGSDTTATASAAGAAKVSGTAAATVAAQSAPVATPVEFSIDTVPISNAPLGKFPFFGLPPKYAPQNTPKPPGYGHFLFWTGKAFKDVDGETYMVTIIAPKSEDFRTYELKKNMEALFQQAGAVKISDAKIPQAALDALSSAVRQELIMGLGDVWNDPAETWVIRRPNDAVWIHYTTNTSEASLAVVQTKPFVASAALLPVDELKSDLDKTGKAVIYVNFASDAATILPTSQAQMDAIATLLKNDPSLKLAINGYTDDTGSDVHNLTLSNDRASAVQAALVSAGIAAGRLQAKGYGRTNPMSNNTDEVGKAANRRVELVKL